MRIGVILQLSGGQGSSDGKQVEAALKLYTQQHGNVAGGKTVELIVKDDGGNVENSKRIAQELIDHDNIDFIGVGLTASALAAGRDSRATS